MTKASPPPLERWEWDMTPWAHTLWNHCRRGTWWVYFIHDKATDELLYIGATNNVTRRMREHTTPPGRYRRSVIRCEIEGPYTSALGCGAAESRHIRTLQPPRQHQNEEGVMIDDQIRSGLNG